MSRDKMAAWEAFDRRTAGRRQALTLESNPEIIATLNVLLRRELTVIIQYMIQSEMCANWGYKKLAGLLKMQAITEMKHAEAEIERIVYLEGVPNVSQLNEIRTGTDVPSIIQNNWDAEREAVDLYNSAIAKCYALGDNGTRVLLEPILADEEKHLDDDQSRLEQIQAMGLPAFLAEQLDE